LLTLCEQIGAERDALAEAGIDVAAWGPAEDGVELSYFAADRQRAEAVLAQRFGPVVIAERLGPSRCAEVPQRFGGWRADGSQLTVFYGLPHNGERPGNCTVEEQSDRVIVSLTILDPQGPKTLAGGSKPSHATVQLTAPLGGRLVIDASDGRPRPECTGRSSDTQRRHGPEPLATQA
jgi:hypothetical protein